MSWDPNEYPDQAGEANSVLQNLENEHQETVEHEQQVVETLSEAMKRIEEANLWKTLLTLDVFQQGSARPEILNAINGKIKKFALNNLELCVGIKTEAQQLKPQTQEVKLPFDPEELTALKILAAKVLKRDISTALTQQTYSPAVSQVTSVDSNKPTGPVINTVKTQTGQTQPQRAPQQPKIVNMAPKKKGPQKPKPGVGYIPPVQGYIPPIQGGATVTSEGVRGGEVNMANLVSNLIQAASGGNVMAQNTNAVESDDINERF